MSETKYFIGDILKCVSQEKPVIEHHLITKIEYGLYEYIVLELGVVDREIIHYIDDTQEGNIYKWIKVA